MEYPELEQETMQAKYFQPCSMQVTSHGAINISKLETAVQNVRNIWISYKERHRSTENLTIFSEAIDTWDKSFWNKNQNHQDLRAESTTSLLPIQPAMSTRIFTGDVAHQSWDMKQPWQKKKTRQVTNLMITSYTHHWWNIRILSDLPKFSRFLLLFASSISNCI